MFYLRIAISGVCLFCLLPTGMASSAVSSIAEFSVPFPWCSIFFQCNDPQVSCHQERSGLHLKGMVGNQAVKEQDGWGSQQWQVKGSQFPL